MSHLSAERLAALADPHERPTPTEDGHLAVCAYCAEERVAYGALLTAARVERDVPGVPLTQWDGLAGRLREEGLVRPAVGGHRAGADSLRRRRTIRRVMPRLAQMAAGIVLLLCGVAAGRLSAVTGPPAVEQGADVPRAVEQFTPDGRRQTADVHDLIPDYRSVGEAQAALERFEVAYQHAAAFLAERDTAALLGGPEDYRPRLAALERAGRTMREAMQEAPYDPVLTGYYLTTLGQREATLRQINVAVPAGARLNSF